MSKHLVISLYVYLVMTRSSAFASYLVYPVSKRRELNYTVSIMIM